MKLPYGLSNGNFIHISEVPSGKTKLHCPFCQQALLAKKGKIKRHHFAHSGPSCIPKFNNDLFGILGKLPIHLPLCMFAKHKLATIKDQLLHLQQQHQLAIQKATNQESLVSELLTILAQLAQKYTDQQKIEKAASMTTLKQQVYRYITKKIAPFPDFHLLRDPDTFSQKYTNGKQQCTLAQLTKHQYEYFYPVSFDKYVQCLKTFHQQNTESPNELQDKINLYEKELAYFNHFKLYFLEITTTDDTLYKIGLTSRSIDIRIQEIKQDLHTHFRNSQVKVLFVQEGVAFIETFFKQKYAAYQRLIGKLTEYFTFPNQQIFLLLKDFHCLQLQTIPDRGTEDWIYWAYFNSNGKIYGGHTSRSIYVEKDKFLLSRKEGQLFSQLVEMARVSS